MRRYAVNAQSYAVLVTDATGGPFPGTKKFSKLDDKSKVACLPSFITKATKPLGNLPDLSHLTHSPAWKSMLVRTGCTLDYIKLSVSGSYVEACLIPVAARMRIIGLPVPCR